MICQIVIGFMILFFKLYVLNQMMIAKKNIIAEEWKNIYRKNKDITKKLKRDYLQY